MNDLDAWLVAHDARISLSAGNVKKRIACMLDKDHSRQHCSIGFAVLGGYEVETRRMLATLESKQLIYGRKGLSAQGAKFA